MKQQLARLTTSRTGLERRSKSESSGGRVPPLTLSAGHIELESDLWQTIVGPRIDTSDNAQATCFGRQKNLNTLNDFFLVLCQL
jgi:hypothetical protein